METYQLDRILGWLSSAIGFNENPEKKYFYEKSERLFFNLGFKNNKYFEWTNQIPLSTTDSAIIQNKIRQLSHDNNDFLEICRSDKQFNVLPINQARTKEEYKMKENNWNLLYIEVEAFLKEHYIDIHATRLIE
jgi:hypothetical protein